MLITQGKTNWKFLLIVVILAAIVGGGIVFLIFTPIEIIERPTPLIFTCEKSSDCISSCGCGCINKNKYYCPGDELKECDSYPCECINNKCIKKDETANWKTYSNPEVDFTFKYPSEWEIKEEYQYKSAACQMNPECKGVRYIFLNKIDDIRSANLGEKDKYGIVINKPQCTGVKWDDLPGNNWICLFDENPEALNIYDQIKKSFQLIEDETANWQTYRNDEYGFEVKYPNNYEIKEEFSVSPITEQEISLTEDPYIKIKRELARPVQILTRLEITSPSFPPEGAKIEIAVHNNPDNLPLNQWLDLLSEAYEGLGAGGRKPVSILGIESIKGWYGCCGKCVMGVFISKGDKVYNLGISGFLGYYPDYVGYYGHSEEDECYLGDESIFNQMLSTFKFLD